jgi:hypothetical protein
MLHVACSDSSSDGFLAALASKIKGCDGVCSPVSVDIFGKYGSKARIIHFLAVGGMTPMPIRILDDMFITALAV